MKHDQKPEIDKSAFDDEEFNKTAQKILQSDYYAHVNKLTKIIKEKIVQRSIAGNSGFILIFDDNSSVVSFIRDEKLWYKYSEDEPSDQDLSLTQQSEYGDPSGPLTVNLPYGDEECDLISEISKSHGKKVTGLSIGEDSFNFCFPGGMELEAMLIPDQNGKVALRVFWEQW